MTHLAHFRLCIVERPGSDFTKIWNESFKAKTVNFKKDHWLLKRIHMISLKFLISFKIYYSKLFKLLTVCLSYFKKNWEWEGKIMNIMKKNSSAALFINWQIFKKSLRNLYEYLLVSQLNEKSSLLNNILLKKIIFHGSINLLL